MPAYAAPPIFILGFAPIGIYLGFGAWDLGFLRQRWTLDHAVNCLERHP